MEIAPIEHEHEKALTLLGLCKYPVACNCLKMTLDHGFLDILCAPEYKFTCIAVGYVVMRPYQKN